MYTKKQLMVVLATLISSGLIAFWGMSYLVKQWGLIAFMIWVPFFYGGFRALPWTKGPLSHAISLGIAIGFFVAPILSITPRD
jgi:hypothetical protein